MSRKRKLDVSSGSPPDDPFLLTQMVDENDRRRAVQRAGVPRDDGDEPPAPFQQLINIPPGVTAPSADAGAVVQHGARAAQGGVRLKFIGLNVDTQNVGREEPLKYKRQQTRRQRPMIAAPGPSGRSVGSVANTRTSKSRQSRLQFVTEPSESLFEAHNKEIEAEGLQSARGKAEPEPKKRKLREIIVIEDDEIVEDDDSGDNEGWITIGKKATSKDASTTPTTVTTTTTTSTTTTAAASPQYDDLQWSSSMEEAIYGAVDQAEREFQQKTEAARLSKVPAPAAPPAPAPTPTSVPEVVSTPAAPTVPPASPVNVPEPIFVEHIAEISLSASLHGNVPYVEMRKIYVDTTRTHRPSARSFHGERAAKQFSNGYLVPTLDEFTGGFVLAALVCLRKSVSQSPRLNNKGGRVKLNGPFALGYDDEEDTLLLYSGQELLGPALPLFRKIAYNNTNSVNNTADVPVTTLKFTLLPRGKHADRIAAVKEVALAIRTLDLGDIYAGIGAIRGKQLDVDYKQFMGRK